MRTFQFTTLAGSKETVEADTVIFTATHVCFTRNRAHGRGEAINYVAEPTPFLVRAVHANNVRNLREIEVRSK